MHEHVPIIILFLCFSIFYLNAEHCEKKSKAIHKNGEIILIIN